jgi:glutamate dehydrogenase
MTTSTLTKSLLKIAAKNGPPDGVDSAPFKAFIAAATPQIRTAFRARHSTEEIFGILSDFVSAPQKQSTAGPTITAERTEKGMAFKSQMADQPFIVDTVLLTLSAHGTHYQSGFNLVLGIGRDKSGRICSVDGPEDPLVSLIYVLTDDTTKKPKLQVDLVNNLRLAGAVVGDFEAMTALVQSTATDLLRAHDEPSPEREAGFLLQWLLADNFIFMGAVHGKTRHGLTDKSVKGLTDTTSLDAWGKSDNVVEVRKASIESRVHRAGCLDEIRIQLTNGTSLKLQGLFTYRGVTQPSRHVPLLRGVLSKILSEQSSKPSSYRYKGIANVFDSLPTEFLFTTVSEEIIEMVDRVLEAEQERRPRAHVMQNPDNGSTFVLAAMPRGRWSDQVRQDIEGAIVDATGASYCDHGVFIGRYSTLLVHFYLTGSSQLSATEAGDLSAEIIGLATGWPERLHAALLDAYPAEQAEQLSIRYAEAFNEMYMQMTPPSQSARDIQLLEAINENNQVLADIFQDDRGRLNLRLYQFHNILLSEILPILDNFGLVILDQFSDPVGAADGDSCTIDTFRLQGVRTGDDDCIIDCSNELIDALEAVFTQKVTDDGLNQLILAARIPWAAVDMIRGYLGYAMQLNLRYSTVRIEEILLAQPELVQGLWRLFHTRFDPTLQGDRNKATNKIREAIEGELRDLRAQDQEITFRTIFNLIDSTLRTNFYRTDRIEHYISFKVDCSKVWKMPEPRMLYEVYVHHPEMEGVHLRGGQIARGGIRWSDRQDYRREVQGLATTQLVKNVLIVPEGAKGGFYLKRTFTDRSIRRAQADRLYTFLIRGLLDLTDNIVGGSVIHPPNVVRYDGDDTYLVVAADKGTAHLSDTANGVAREYGFWLDDAFASGGSNGYDHKKVGITARGAWRTTQRHFAEMGKDPYKEDFTCAAIGDPGGDVFGNGVIESPHMKLVAAFNHLHIFIDPDPDPKISYEERLRMFKAVQGWDHYNTKLLSKGGGIFSRKARSIQLTPKMKDLLGVMSDELEPDVVIRLILRLPVDLLWNGGIGTYIKSSEETHTDVGDATNDSLRIDARELRCKIVGEGGNLGLTQAARVEYALNQGRINNDAIDNSGGVDMSDHEVNLKILLADVMATGKLKVPARNKLLERLTETVADLVLDNSDTHANQLSLDQVRSNRDPLFFSRTIDWVCRHSNTTRAALTLPSDDDLSRRIQSRIGLTRPELAVLQAHVKMHILKELLDSDPSEIPDFDERVLRYFPDDIRRKYEPFIAKHMLHKSIGMTVLITEVMGDTGVLFYPMLKEWTGATAIQISRAWLLAMDTVNGHAIRVEIDSCDAPFDAKYRAWIEVQNAITGVAAFALSAGESGLAGDPTETIREVLRQLPRVRGAAHQEQLTKMGQGHLDRGIPEATSLKIATLTKLTVAREIALLHEPGARVSHTVIRYIAVGEATGILPALRAMRIERTSGPWDQVALSILRNRFFLLMRQLYGAIPLGPEVRLGINRIKRRLTRHGPLSALANEVDRLLSSRPDIAMLLVAEDRIRSALASGLGDIDMSSAKSVSKGKGKDRTKEVSAKHDSPTPPEK